jgi:hypothetical protein
MTPKEKAKELFDKYCWAIRIEETDSGYFSNVLYAKQCALITVDEIQNVISLLKTTLNITAYKTAEDFNRDIRYNESLRHEAILYFDFVKQEIEKL